MVVTSPSAHAGAEASAGWSGLELISTAVLLLDDAQVVRHANPAAENLFELSRARLRGMPIGALFADARLVTDAIDNATTRGFPFTEQEVELGIGGKPRAHLAMTATPVDHDVVRMVLEFRPIDHQLRIARDERQREQQQANRELIRNLAHEIKNPLGGIRGAAQLLERELDAPPLIEYTQVIIGESDRLQSLVNRLLTPHRQPAFRRTNLHELLVRVKGVVQAEFPSIGVVADFDASLPEIDADPEQITQALLNIVRNAAQALSGTTKGPEIRLVTRVARYVTLARRRHRLAIAISIEDNGPGIAAALRERIFYPLVSGREGGSGLGLTIAQTLVAQHAGTIDYESEPGATAFRVLLPVETGSAGPGT